VLEWRPRDFWESTPIEFGAALAGRVRANQSTGAPRVRQEIGDNGVPLPPGMSRAEALKLAAWNEQVAGEEGGA
jgi:hypothetical protein